jgi:cytochrome c551
MRNLTSLTFITLFAMACGGKAGRVDDINALEGDSDNGAIVFADNCAACHGADGTGGSGPDITGEDDQDEVTDVVLNGEDEMPAYDGDLSDQEIADVVAYVLDVL